ncbi:hypothetical protein EG834_01770 [bacterium]|nr:hypothetical protein [bacterium]
MTLSSDIFTSLLPGKIIDIHVGYSRTAVLAETTRGLSCGLAATLANPAFMHRCNPSVANAGHLLEMSTAELVNLAESDSYTEVSIGLAAINALVPINPADCVELNAEVYLREHAMHKNVALVGHFPFVERLKPDLNNLWVLELDPRDGDIPAELAPEYIPKADVVAITATTLINHTFEGLLALCRPESRVMVLGPSTPLSPVLFDKGVDLLCGTIVTDPKAAFLGISQGASSHQLHEAGATMQVTLQRKLPIPVTR